MVFLCQKMCCWRQNHSVLSDFCLTFRWVILVFRFYIWLGAKVENYKQIRSKIRAIFAADFSSIFTLIFEVLLSEFLPCFCPHFFIASWASKEATLASNSAIKRSARRASRCELSILSLMLCSNNDNAFSTPSAWLKLLCLFTLPQK